jgi:predicted transcriptional regulator
MNHILLIIIYLKSDSFVHDNDTFEFIKYRNKIDVIAIILQAVKDNNTTGITKSAIRAKSFMPYSRLKEYMRLLLGKGLNQSLEGQSCKKESGVVACNNYEEKVTAIQRVKFIDVFREERKSNRQQGSEK